MRMGKFVLEGEWTGYRSDQRRVVHREVVSAKFAEQAKDLRCIVYTDGTSLLVHLREKLPRERVVEVDSYSSLIRDAVKHGGSRVSVTDLPD
jgi:hypothetical protein